MSRIQFWPGNRTAATPAGGNASTRHRLRQSQQYPLAFLRPQPKSFGVFFGEVSWSAGTGALLKWKGDPDCCVRDQLSPDLNFADRRNNHHCVIRVRRLAWRLLRPSANESGPLLTGHALSSSRLYLATGRALFSRAPVVSSKPNNGAQASTLGSRTAPRR